MRLQAVNGLLVSVQDAGTDNAVRVYASTPLDATDFTWETIVEETVGRGVVALRCNGRYLTGHEDGHLECRATQIGAWECWIKSSFNGRNAYRSEAWGGMLQANPSLPVLGHPIPGACHVILALDAFNAGPWEQFKTLGAVDHAFGGKLVKKNGAIYDDSGPRLVHGYLDMPAVRLVADDPDEVERTLDAGLAAGRYVAKSAFALCESEDQNGGFWRGRIVLPELAKSGALIKYADMAKARGMYLWLFGSHNFGGSANKLKEFFLWMADALYDAGHADTIAAIEWYSEFPLTSPWGGGDESYVRAAECLKIVRDKLGCITTMGAPGEDPDELVRTATVGNLVSIDLGRDYTGAQIMHHAHTIYNEGIYHGKYNGAIIGSTEPAGPDAGSGGDMYIPLEDPAWIFGQHAIFAVYYQASLYFSGPGVRHRVPIDQGFGFKEFAPMFNAFLPQDVCTWGGSNPSWMIKGNEFVIVVAEEWNLLGRPPRQIDQWTALFYDGSQISGSGPIRLAPGWKACIVKGTFV